MNKKITFVKEKDMVELTCSSEERETLNEALHQFIVLVVDCRRKVMGKVKRLTLHEHLEEVARQINKREKEEK
jgi:hypothetical protein